MSLLTGMGENKPEQIKKLSPIGVRLHTFIVNELKQAVQQGEAIDSLIEKLAERFLANEGNYLTFEQKKQLIDDVSNTLTEYGPILTFLIDPTIKEIMVNGPKAVYINVNGQFEKTAAQFRDDTHVLRVINQFLAPLGLRMDESIPIMDATLPDGSHINAVIPPLARKGPTLTIRKLAGIPFTVSDLVRMETLNENMVTFLKAAVEAKLTILISGEADSGKTTTLNALSSFIPEKERIVTIEEATELRLAQDHVVSLESQSLEEDSEITIRDLVQNLLRMQPDRIIIGDVCGSETFEMLQAMNTDYIGSLGTVHANSPRELLAEFETMVLTADHDVSIRAIRKQLAGALDLIVQQTRMKDGTRKITRITEVLGVDGDAVILQDIFVYKEQKGLYTGQFEGHFKPTGIRPNCLEKLGLPSTYVQELFTP
ncbi:CpaF family protein [Virgibacillus ndiopensis]|uniref:CpaF family protein n=1 Tax=Virgibacillus ndiopensis TaxID=2004408 RepID=UPI001FE55DF3|nr:CpaF family protein [Virgibacillus ndiopensis]